MNKTILINNKSYQYKVISKTDREITLDLNGKNYTFGINKKRKLIKSQGQSHQYALTKKSNGHELYLNGKFYTLSSNIEDGPSTKSQGSLKSPMPGKILDVVVKVGDKVKQGDKLLILEAMKMEHTIKAPIDGVINKIFYAVGDQVTSGKDLVEIAAK